MPLPVAAVATATFCAYLALYPAAVGWTAVQWTIPRSWPRAVAAAAPGRSPSGRAASCSRVSRGSSLGYAALGGNRPEPARRVRARRRRLPGHARDRRCRRGIGAGRRRHRHGGGGASRRPGRRDGGRGRGRHCARARRMDGAVRRARRGIARPRQRRAGTEVRPGFPPDDLRPLRGTREHEPRASRGASGERIPGVRGRGAGKRAAAGAGHRGGPGR